jgi:signal transduction histidine kinase
VPPDGWNAAAPLVEDTPTYVKVRYLPIPEPKEAADQTRDFGEQYHGFLAVPLISAAETYGVLTLSYREARQFTSEEVALAMAFADQATLGVENARVTDQSLRLAAAEERQRLAHDLHDSVAQVLYGIALGAGTAKRHLASNPATVAEPIDYISSLAAAGLAEMRALIFDLQPDSLAKDGLLKAVERQVEALEARHGLTVVNRIVQEPDIPVETKEAVYLVIREAVHNVVKHAQATQVVIELSEADSSVVFRVSDDGAGFDSNASYPGHLGLHSMRDRVQQLGGRLSLQSVPGQGTTVEGHLPANGSNVGAARD